MAYSWSAPSPLPPLLPWVMVVILLLLKPNRIDIAWWIWAPLVCSYGLQAFLKTALSSVPSQPLDAFQQAVHALSFGLAALWLLAPFLRTPHRFLKFLGSLVILAGFSGLTFVLSSAGSTGGIDALQTVIVAAVAALIIAVALSLSGRLCRRGYRPVRLTLTLAGSILAACLVVIAPFFVLAMVNSRGNLPVTEFLEATLVLAAVCIGIVLPFLVLSFANRLYGERLVGLLRLGGETEPPVIAPERGSITAAPVEFKN